MKNLSLIAFSLTLFGMLFQSCEDYEEVSEPDFTVTPTTTNIKVGELITFKVENAPDFLMFYSGEFGHQYKFRDRTEAEGTVTMSFKNAQKYGLGTNATGTLSVWVANDYDGSGTPEAVANATWTDLSNRFNIATAYDFAWTESDVADITDLANGQPIYFAFKFFAEDHKGNGNRQPEWHIDDFNIRLETEDAPAPLIVATTDNPGFLPVDVQGLVETWNEGKWYYDTGNLYWRFRGGPSEYANEDWLITNTVNLTAVSPDTGTPLKNYSTALDSFTYTYSKPGTYTVTFNGNNTTVHGNKEKVKEMTITVVE